MFNEPYKPLQFSINLIDRFLVLSPRKNSWIRNPWLSSFRARRKLRKKAEVISVCSPEMKRPAEDVFLFPCERGNARSRTHMNGEHGRTCDRETQTRIWSETSLKSIEHGKGREGFAEPSRSRETRAYRESQCDASKIKGECKKSSINGSFFRQRWFVGTLPSFHPASFSSRLR